MFLKKLLQGFIFLLDLPARRVDRTRWKLFFGDSKLGSSGKRAVERHGVPSTLFRSEQTEDRFFLRLDEVAGYLIREVTVVPCLNLQTQSKPQKEEQASHG